MCPNGKGSMGEERKGWEERKGKGNFEKENGRGKNGNKPFINEEKKG